MISATFHSYAIYLSQLLYKLLRLLSFQIIHLLTGSILFVSIHLFFLFSYITYLFVSSSLEDKFSLLLEGEEGNRERLTWKRNIYWSPSCMHHTPAGDGTHSLDMSPDWESTYNFWSVGRCSNQLSHTGQARLLILNRPSIPIIF